MVGGNGKKGGGFNSTSDPLVVRTEDLARLLNIWIKQHDAEHPQLPKNMFGSNQFSSDTGSFESSEAMPTTTGRQFLAEHLDVDTSRLNVILKGHSKWTSFRVADVLLTAAGLTHVFGTEIVAVPNPRWSQERWEAWNAEHGACAD